VTHRQREFRTGRTVLTFLTAIGALAGAALIEIIRNSMGLLGINPFWQGTVIGGAILFAVAFERVRQLRARD